MLDQLEIIGHDLDEARQTIEAAREALSSVEDASGGELVTQVDR